MRLNRRRATLTAASVLIGAVCAMGSLAAEPEVYVFEMIPTPTPTLPAPAPTPEPKPFIEYEWSEAEIDGLASVYWAECNTETEKLAVTQLIMNRVTHGAPFASDLVGVIHQKGEFNRGRVSDRNRALAESNLNTIMNGLCRVPKTAVYMSRSGKTLVFYDITWKEVWRSGR